MRWQRYGIGVAGQWRAAVGLRQRAREMLRQHRGFERRGSDSHGRERAAAAMHLLRQQFAHVGNDGERQPQRDAALEPLQRGVPHQRRGDDVAQFLRAHEAVDRGVVSHIVPELGQPDQLAEADPLRRRHYGDAEPAVLGHEVAGRITTAEPVEAGTRPREAGFQRQPGVEFRDVQECFVQAHREAARAGGVSIKPGETRNERGEAAGHGELPVARQHRRSFDRPHQFDQPRETAADRLGHGVVAIRSVLAEPGERGDGETRLGAAQVLVRQHGSLKFGQRSGIEQEVRCREQRADLGDVRGDGEIGGDAVLVGVEPGEGAAFLPSTARVDQRCNAPRGIAAGRLDLDHLGAEIRKQLAAIVQRIAGTELDHANSSQRKLLHLHSTCLQTSAFKRKRATPARRKHRSTHTL